MINSGASSGGYVSPTTTGIDTYRVYPPLIPSPCPHCGRCPHCGHVPGYQGGGLTQQPQIQHGSIQGGTLTLQAQNS